MADWNDRVAGNWNQFAGKVKEQWGKLLMTTSPASMATDNSWKVVFRSSTVATKILRGDK
jgi:hypothetical protein